MEEKKKRIYIKEYDPMQDYPLDFQKGVAGALLIMIILFLSIRKVEVTPYHPKEEKSTYVEEINLEVEKIEEVAPPPKPKISVEVQEAEAGEEAEATEEVDIAATTDFNELEAPPPPETDTTVYEYYAVEIPPKPIKTVKPKYPELARKAGIEGQVFVQAIVGPDGRVKRAWVVKSTNNIFDAAAVEAVLQMVFSPARQQDKPVSCKVIVPIRFTLNQ